MVVLFLVLQLLFMEQLYCSGVGKIKFLRYEDKSNCDDGDIKDLCDFYFKPLTIQDEDGSVLHNIPKTTVYKNTASVNLTEVKELKYPINITVPTNKTVTIVTTVWDSDIIDLDDEVRKITDFKVPFENVSVGDGWEEATKTSTGPNMKFTVQYKLTQCDDNFTGLGCNFCKTDYFTELCDNHCVPVPGNYTCNSTTGDKICEAEKTGDDCDQCVNGKAGQVCDSCARAHHFGEDCTIYCEPDEYYMCSECGHKICLDNTTSVANNCREGHKITLPQPVVWISLAGVFFLTTVLLAIFAARKFLKRNVCTSKNAEPEHEYVDNVIARLPSRSSTAGICDESHYSNKELYEL